MRRPPLVAVLGGGVAGLSAAHELAERGFRVRVYEHQPILGGKARSIALPGTGVDGRRDLPGEHGFRFFPRFYWHVTDVMRRIPYGRNRNGVFDNLVDVDRFCVTHPGRETYRTNARFPRNWRELRDLTEGLRNVIIDLSMQDRAPLAGLAWRLMSMCPERRADELDNQAWSEVAGWARSSPGFQALTNVTQLFVALRAEGMSAKTAGDIGMQIMAGIFTPGGSVDRVLTGPTSDVWIEPWREHLARLGVEFQPESTVIRLVTGDGRITGAVVRRQRVVEQVEADFYLLAVPVGPAAQLVGDELAALDPGLARLPELATHTRWMVGIQYFLEHEPPVERAHYIHMHTPWSLTSVVHQQFWPDGALDHFGDGRTRAVLSVDICDCESVGGNGRTLPECSAEEIAREVWRQLEEGYNGGGARVLRWADVRYWLLDPSLVPPDPATGRPASYAEPMFVNMVGGRSLRPTARTRLPNLALASDYVLTNTDLACMEGANEAARHAVNTILRASGYGGSPCEIRPLRDPLATMPLRVLDRWRYARRRRQTGTEPGPAGTPDLVGVGASGDPGRG